MHHWYIIIRKTYTANRERLLCFQNVDAVKASSHDAAKLEAYQRNPCKPDQVLDTAKAVMDFQQETAVQLWAKRNRENSEFVRFMLLEERSVK